MKMEIKRETLEKKGMLGGKKKEYSLSVKIIPTQEESRLFETYESSDSPMVAFLPIDTGNPIEGSSTTSFRSLCGGGRWMSKGYIHKDFAQIPFQIVNELRSRIGVMLFAEEWHGRDEVTDILAEPSTEGAVETSVNE